MNTQQDMHNSIPDMDWSHSTTDGHAVQMVQKPTAFPSFLGRRSFVPRPISNATDFFDLDNDSNPDESPSSLASLDRSDSTVSSQGLKTPHSAGLGGFEFHFDDKPVAGPYGPHLFLGTPESFQDLEHTKSAELPIELPASAKPASPRRPVTSLNQAVAELDETQVRSWTPVQVADWMAEAGFETTVVEKFLIHDITGSVLIDLQFEDLKELDISSFGKRHKVMSSIHHLRNSALITECNISRTPSRTTQPTRNATPPQRSSRALTRSVAPEECHIVATSRSRSRRQGRKVNDLTEVSPGESVSIVAIEQLLPKPHKCSKGEDCAKWQKQQRKIQRIQAEFAAEIQDAPAEEQKSEILPSIVGSSDVLGPTPPFKITAERLNEVQVRDVQESVRQFLSFQHVNGSAAHGPSPPPAASAGFSAKTNPLAEHLRGLPKLTIPDDAPEAASPHRTPFAEMSNPTSAQARLKKDLLNDPYHYGGVASPADIYRIDTPLSAADVPVTQHPTDPIGERIISQSVPPEMRYGGPVMWTTSGEPIERCLSTTPSSNHRRRLTKNSFAPAITPVQEGFVSQSAGAQTSRAGHTSTDILAHAGWMRKRRTNRTIRHNEWADNFFHLSGNQLMMFETDHPLASNDIMETIDVDKYAVHAYSQATSSKLSAAFKRSILGAGYMHAEPSFAFSLVPDPHKGENRKQMFESKSGKAHHFAVKSGNEKVEWMRRLMLAKAASRNGSGATEI